MTNTGETRKRVRTVLSVTLVLALILTAAAALLAPYVYVELWPHLYPSDPVRPGPIKLIRGRMAGDYFAVEDLGGGTYAIGEPRYYQANYSYLLLGTRRALLFDAGSGMRDMRKVVSSLTPLPVTVIPSHLHYDHLAGITAFEHVAMVDLPETRADMVGDRFTPGRYEFLGMIDNLRAPIFRVSEWIAPGETIDLGGRSVIVISTPGHTSQSIALWDRAAHRLFTGDFIYPTMLYAFLPDASLAAYRATTRRLLATLPTDTRLWAAHCCRRDEVYAAPWLSMTDLKDLDQALARRAAGTLKSEGFFPRRYPVNDQMMLGTGFF